MADNTVICTAAALYDYTANDDDELSLVKGEVVDVLSKQEDGWWNVIKQAGAGAGIHGLIPSNYVYVRVPVKENKKAGTSSAGDSLPPGWESSLDPESGERYYYNQGTGQVQWSTPGKDGRAPEHKGKSGIPHPRTQHNNYMAPTHHQGYDHSNPPAGGSGAGYANGSGNAYPKTAKMDKSDLAEFKRLREEADAKLAALRDVLSMQENLHLLEAEEQGEENDRCVCVGVCENVNSAMYMARVLAVCTPQETMLTLSPPLPTQRQSFAPAEEAPAAELGAQGS